jgi:hypothetical protein
LLGGKIDAVLDSKTERFRRDSLLMLLLGIGFSLYLPLAALSGRSLWLPGLMAILGYIVSLWEWLAYQHSLSFGKELNLLVSTPIKPDDRLIHATLARMSDEERLAYHQQHSGPPDVRYPLFETNRHGLAIVNIPDLFCGIRVDRQRRVA